MDTLPKFLFHTENLKNKTHSLSWLVHSSRSPRSRHLWGGGGLHAWVQ